MSNWSMRGIQPSGDLSFSFSGVKTSLRYLVEELGPTEVVARLDDLCASYQQAVIDALVRKTAAALDRGGYASLGLSGGVSNNRTLRAALARTAQEKGVAFHAALPQHTGDNAGMIAFAAWCDSAGCVCDDHFDLAIQPAPLVVDAAEGARQRLAVSFENRGNVPLTIDLAGRYPLGEEVALSAERIDPPADGVERLSRIIDQTLGLAPRPALVEVGGVELSMPDGPFALEPGAMLTADVEIALPEDLSPFARLHVVAPVYAADLHIVIVTAAKPATATRRTRRTKGAEG